MDNGSKPRDPWVLVESESELRAGMTVQLRNCAWCGRMERRFLVACDGRRVCQNADGTDEMSLVFEQRGSCKAFGNFCGVSRALAERRLFRLRDLDEPSLDEVIAEDRRMLAGELEHASK